MSSQRLRSSTSGRGLLKVEVEASSTKVKTTEAYLPGEEAGGASTSKAAQMTESKADETPDCSDESQEQEENSKIQKASKVSKLELESHPGVNGSGNIDLDPAAAAGLAENPIEVTKAMQNELILGAVAKKLPIGNLLSLRPTSTIWNRNFIPQLAKKTIDLSTIRPKLAAHRCYLDCESPRSLMFISDYTKLMESSTNIPFQSYNICNLGLGRLRDIKYFFEVFGQTITRLGLHLNSYSTVNPIAIQTLRQIVFEWTPELRELTICTRIHSKRRPRPRNLLEVSKKQLPKLRKITLIQVPGVQLHGYHQPFHRLLDDLFECATGLDYLSVEVSARGRWLARALANSLQCVDDLSILDRLKHLHVTLLEAQHLRHLTRLGSLPGNPLQLVELKMSLAGYDHQDTTDEGNEEVRALCNAFLVTQSRSLRTLHITTNGMVTIDNDSFRSVPRLPKMEKVHSLIVQRDAKWRLITHCNHGTFESNFPGLKSLGFIYELYDAELEGSVRVSVNQFSHEGVTSLKLELQKKDADETWAVPLSVLPPVWPSILMLDLQIPASVFKLLISFWTLWPALLSLRVELIGPSDSSTVVVELDEILSGIPSSKFKALRRQLKSGSAAGPTTPTMDSLSALQAKYKKKPGISELKQLQEFVLDSGKEGHSFKVTDIGGYFGLALIPNQAVQHIALLHKIGDQNQNQDGTPKSTICSQHTTNTTILWILWILMLLGKIAKPLGFLRSESKHKKVVENGISDECRTFMRSVFGPNAVIDL